MKGKKGPLGYIFIQLFLDKGRSVFGSEYIQNFSSIFCTIFYWSLSSEILDNRIRTTTFRRSIAWRQANIPYSPPRRSISWVPSVSKFWSAHVVNQKVGWRIKTYHQVWNSHNSLNDLKNEWKRENSYLARFHQKVWIIRIKNWHWNIAKVVGILEVQQFWRNVFALTGIGSHFPPPWEFSVWQAKIS